MEIEDPINHFKAFFIKKNNFHLNYIHVIHGNKDNNKDKLFIFRFLLNPRISFQKVEFMLDLYYKFLMEKKSFL